MKIVFLGLSVLFGMLTGLLYDLQMPILKIGLISVSGPALATSLTVSLVLACSMIGISLVLSRLDRIAAPSRAAFQFNHAIAMPRFGIVDGGRSEDETVAKTITATRRLPVADLADLELRAERTL